MWESELTVINDQESGLHPALLEAAQALHDPLGRDSEVVGVPGAPPKQVQRGWQLLLVPAATISKHTFIPCCTPGWCSFKDRVDKAEVEV